MKKHNHFWHELISEDKIPYDTVIIITDHQGKKKIGSSYRTKTNPANEPENIRYLIPFGVVFCYRDSISGRTKRISRYIIPNTISLTTHQTNFILKKILEDDGDHELRDLLLNRRRAIVIFFSV